MRKVRSKRVALKPFNSKIYYKNKIFEIESGHNIFFNFKKRIKKYGVSINTIDIKNKIPVDRYVYCDVPYPWEIDKWYKLVRNKERNVLFTFESPSVNPFSHFKVVHKLFKRVYAWNNHKVDGKKYFRLFIPQLNSVSEGGIRKFKEKKFLATVISNKSVPFLFKLFKPYTRDLYIERERAINFFENKIPFRFSLYGKGWDKPKPFSLKEKIFGFKRHSSYKGEIKNKLRLLSSFKFCLAFENSSASGYITEKIFDCFKAGCVPIYLGAPDVEKYIPKSCFIDYRDFDGYGDLLYFLDSISERKYKGYIKKAQEFLKRETTLNRWFERSFEKTFLEAIS